MPRATTIQYDTAKLEAQLPSIRESQLKAMRRIIIDNYFDDTGLKPSDPPELWRFVISLSESLWDAALFSQFRSEFGSPTLNETVSLLAQRIHDPEELARNLNTLLRIHSRGHLSEDDYKENVSLDERILVENWIQYPLRRNWAIGSLCFFSELALAKIIYRLKKKTWLPPTLLTKEPERIRKLRDALGLIRAKPRVIKDIELKAGKIRWIAIKKTHIKSPRKSEPT